MANDTVLGNGLTIMYVNESNGQLYDRTFSVYRELLKSDQWNYLYGYTFPDELSHAQGRAMVIRRIRITAYCQKKKTITGNFLTIYTQVFFAVRLTLVLTASSWCLSGTANGGKTTATGRSTIGNSTVEADKPFSTQCVESAPWKHFRLGSI